MRVINLRSGVSELPRITALCYGATRSGKTRFAAGWPRPLFLSDVTESGWTTLQTMDPGAFYEPDRDPIVWGIESITDMAEASVKVDALIAKGEVKTIVIDSLTFYADLYFNQLMVGMGSKPDTRRAYGDLNTHLRDLRVRFHQKRANIVWLALDKQPDSENPVGGPMIPGQQASKFTAGCDFIFYHRQFQEGQHGPRWEVRTRKYGAFVAGGRDGGILPDPMEPSYLTLIDSLRPIQEVFAAATPEDDVVVAPVAPLVVASAVQVPAQINAAPVASVFSTTRPPTKAPAPSTTSTPNTKPPAGARRVVTPGTR